MTNPAGKCPACGQLILTVMASPVTIDVGPETRFQGLTYKCSNVMCQTVFGCQIDPIALKTDIINGVAELLDR